MWSKDENSFGHKLLAKMGWKKGKGMGKNEDGISECIKVDFKRDTKGVGFSEKLSANVHSKGFDALLSSLNEDHSTENESTNIENESEITEISLENHSKKFRNRLHYQKFIRGKDVSKYSKKDMESIFGHKLKDDCNSTTKDKSNSKSDENGEIESSLSMSDYFSKKLKERNAKLLTLNNKSTVGALENNLNHNHFEESNVDASMNGKFDEEVLQKLSDIIDYVLTNNLDLNQSEENQVDASGKIKSDEEKSLKSDKKNEILESNLNNGQSADITVEKSEINFSEAQLPDTNLNGNSPELDSKNSRKRKRNNYKPNRFKFNGRWIKSILSKTDEVSRLYRRSRQNKDRKVNFRDSVSVRQIGEEVYQDYNYSMLRVKLDQEFKESKRRDKDSRRQARMREEVLKQKELNKLVEEALVKQKELVIRMEKALHKENANDESVKSNLQNTEENNENCFNEVSSAISMESVPENEQNEDTQQGVVKKKSKSTLKKLKRKLKLRMEKAEIKKDASLNQNPSISVIEDIHDGDNEVHQKKKRKLMTQNDATLDENVSNHDDAKLISLKSNHKGTSKQNIEEENDNSIEKSGEEELTDSNEVHQKKKRKLMTQNDATLDKNVSNYDDAKLISVESNHKETSKQKIEEENSNSIDKSCDEELTDSKLQETKNSSVPETKEQVSKNSVCKSTNTWRESHKLALRMSRYKFLLKKLSRHSILGTSNLHEIKGYGNW